MLEKTKNMIKHVLISQIKNVGDVVLALPVAGLIRTYYPDSVISFLATHYTQSIVSGCSDINHVLDWDTLKVLSDAEVVQQLQILKISAIIHLCNDNRIARLAKKAGIPYRIGTFQRLPHWIYCNRWINQARRHSHLHEVELNVQMLKPLGIRSSLDFSELVSYIHLQPKALLPKAVEALLSPNRFNLILHPGSNGHGREWSSTAFQQLIDELPAEDYQIFLTGGPQEQERFRPLIQHSSKIINLMGSMTLEELLTFISKVDGLVASGTGPLHMAAALGIKTLGLFPPRQGISPRRWTPVGRQASALVYDRPFLKVCLSCRNSIGCFCMTQIQVSQVLNVIKRWRDEKTV